MSGRWRTLWRGAVTAAAIASPFATHILVATGTGLPLALALAAAQWSLCLGILSRTWTGRSIGVAGAAVLSGLALAAGLVTYRASLRIPAEIGLLVVSGLSHTAINAMLFLVFASTLRPGRVPLVVQMGRILDPNFHPAIERYAVMVTKAWCVFFVAQIGGSALLLTLAPVAVWSFFVNVLDLPLVAAMFVAEDLARRMMFPRHPHVGLVAVARHMRQGGWATMRDAFMSRA